MNERTILAPPELFPAPLPLIGAVFYTIAGAAGLGAVGSLFLPGGLSALTEDLFRGGVTDFSSIVTWTVIHVGLILSGFLCALGMAAGLILEGRKQGRGLNLLHDLAGILLRAVTGTGWCALAIGIFRMVRYLWLCLGRDDGIYRAYVMLIPEGLMIAQAVGLYTLLRRFLDSVCDGAASMAYTRLTGKLDHCTIPGLCATGYFVIGAVNGYLALERLTTMVIVPSFPYDYYSILFASHPVLICTAVMFGCGGIANVLTGLYLKRFKRDAERLVFRSMREKLGH